MSPLSYGVLLLLFFYKQHQTEKQILKNTSLFIYIPTSIQFFCLLKWYGKANTTIQVIGSQTEIYFQI